MSPVWDSRRVVNRGRRSVSPSSDRDIIVRVKSNTLDEKERFRRDYRTSPKKRYESEEEDRYSDNSQNGSFTQNHTSQRLHVVESSRYERYDERYTPERSSYRNNNHDIRYEIDKHKKEQSAHDKYRQRDSDTFRNEHVDKYQLYDRRRRNDYYDDGDSSDDVNSLEDQMYFDRRDRPLNRTNRTNKYRDDSSNHRNSRLRQTDSESAASYWSTDETRQLEDGEIRSPSRDRTGNARLKQERLDLSPVSNKSNNSAFDQHYDSDTNRSYTNTYEESSTEDENEYLVKQQPDAFAKKYTVTLDTLELLKTLTDELEQEIAADIMAILLSAEIALPIETLRDKLKIKNKFFELVTLEKFLQGKFRVEETKLTTFINVPAGTMVVSPFPNTRVKLCAKHSNLETRGKCDCNDLHICKFFLLSRCPTGSNCRFGHNLGSDHNIRVLKTHFLHRLTLKQIKNFICRKENRNRTTTPEICKFYNTERGCKHDTGFDSRSRCQYLNVCRFYISSSCKFKTRCKRSHDLFSGQPRKVLSLYGLEPEFGSQYSQDILAMLKRVTNSSDEVTTTRPKDLQMQADLLVNDTKMIDGKPNEANFIPLVASDQDRYYSHHSTDSNSNSKGHDSLPDVSEDSSAISSEEEADSETEIDACKKHASRELAKTNNLRIRKRNLTTDTLESADRAKMPKLSGADENSDALDTTMTLLPLQTKELPGGLEYIGLDNLKKETSSERVAKIDVDIKASVQKKELQEVGTIEKASVDTVNMQITSKKDEFPADIENVDMDISKTERSSAVNKSLRVMENGDADTIRMKISFQAKEVSEALRNYDVDTSATEIPLKTSNPPDHCMAAECDNKPSYYSVDVWRQPDPVKLNSEQNVFTNKTGGSEQVQATPDLTADQDANDTEHQYQRSLPSPSEIKRKETTDIKEATDTELVGQEQNPGEGDANRKGGKTPFHYSKSNMESYEVFRLSCIESYEVCHMCISCIDVLRRHYAWYMDVTWLIYCLDGLLIL